MQQKILKIATYNILLSRHTKDIINNVVGLANDGVAVFYLQEVLKTKGEPFIVDSILKNLGQDWKAIYHLGNEGSFLDFGTCIIWNTRILKLKKEKRILLPVINRLTFHELIFHKLAGLAAISPPRRAISCLFEYKSKDVLIASIHLDSVGGKNNRMKQVRYLLNRINQSDTPYKIICGDFNSFDLLKTGKEKKNLQSLFGDTYTDASKNIQWSADLYRMDIPKRFPFFVLLIKIFHIHIKRKLDYVWVNNFEVITCKTIDLPGSDHFPVIATLKMK